MTLKKSKLFIRALFIMGLYLVHTGSLISQSFSSENIQYASILLDKQFEEWTTFKLDVASLSQVAKSNDGYNTISLNVGGNEWLLDLEPSRLLSPQYTLKTLSNEGYKTHTPGLNKAFKGREVNSGGHVRLVLDVDFIGGFIEQQSETYYIQPLFYLDKTAPRDIFIMYPKSKVKPRNLNDWCVAIPTAEERYMDEHEEAFEGASAAKMMACYETEVAIASDRSMFDKYGSVGDVENHNFMVLNDVQPNYTGAFNHNIEFVIFSQVVITGTDPWSSSTNASTLLNSFATWGNNNGFGGQGYDLGEIWTDRNFDNNVLGVAYVSGLCSASKYHALSDWTTNSDLLRETTAHEIGHNFSCQHDASGCNQWIMCPTVNTSNSWSAASISSVNNFLPNKINGTCLTACASGPPLEADFSWSPNPGCVNQSVQFTDLSTGAISSRTWQFPGGIPATSTQQNPTVTYTTGGIKNVTLTVNGSSPSNSITKQVTVLANPVANFTYVVNGTTVTLTNTSTAATDYVWEFGNGAESTDFNATYTYNEGGFYTIILTASNDCGSSTKSITVNTAPTVDFLADPATGCVPFQASFISNASPNTTTLNWSFPGGSPATSTLANPNVFYPNPGSYDVTLTAINSVGSSTEFKTSYIVAVPQPTASFTQAINGSTVNFTNTSNNANSYNWNFGDGTTSTLVSPTHTYTTGGVYTVVLTATGTCGTKTATQTVTLIAPPAAAFTAAPTSGCGPLTVSFTNQSTGGATGYSWSFPGGSPSTSTDPNPTVVYAVAGTYSVSLVASNVAGSNTANQNNYITVNGGPTAGFSAAVNNATASFSNTSANATSYAWNFGDGTTSIAPNPVHTYATGGTFTVTLEATNACGNQTATQTVVAVVSPTANFSWTPNPAAGCTPLTVQYTNTSAGAPTGFSWSFPGGTPSSSTAENPVVTYMNAGTYSVSLTVNNSAGSNMAAQNNIVSSGVGPTASFAASENGMQVSFVNNSSAAISYNWNFGDGGTSNEANPTHSYGMAGTYTVTLTATNPCGTNSVSQTVTITAAPTASFTWSPNPALGCNPFTVQFTSTSTGNPTTYAWSFPGGSPNTSSSPNPTVTYSNVGVYSVTLTATNASGSSTATETNIIAVTSPAFVLFNYTFNGNTVNFTNGSAGATTYLWDFGDGTTSTDFAPSHTYANTGTYNVTLSAFNVCGPSVLTLSIVVSAPPVANFTYTPGSGCAPFNVKYTNQSTGTGNSRLWSFPGGEPATSTAQNPSVKYSTPGVYSATLTVTNNAGTSTLTLPDIIVVGIQPTAGFTLSKDSLTVTFSNSSQYADSYEWTFGDGGTSTLQNPVHTYATDGNYTVVLTTTNSCGTKTATQSVQIITRAKAGFAANATTGCLPFTVNFLNQSSANATTWEWSFPGGTPSASSAKNPVVVYGMSGVYDVTLIATSGGGSDTLTLLGYITVNSLPGAGFSSVVNGSIVQFTSNVTNATAYSWDLGDGTTSGIANPSHVYANDGVYTVSLTTTNSCGSNTASETVTVVTPPVADFKPSVLSGCAPLTVQFTNLSSANATNYFWTFEGGSPATSISSEPIVSWNMPGIYTVTLQASNAAGTSTTTQTITVNAAPSASFAANAVGLTVDLVNNSIGATSYAWDFGDGNVSTLENPTHTYAGNGMYTVVLSATNDCGTTVFTQVVNVLGVAPTAIFTSNANAGICAPLTVAFTDESIGNPSSWLWSFPGGTPSTSTMQNPTVVYNSAGNYDVSLTVSNAIGSNTSNVQNVVFILGLPNASFTTAANLGIVTFTNTSSNALPDGYLWNFGDGTNSTLANPVHTYSTNGSYNVTLVATNACGTGIFQQSVNVNTVGLEEAGWMEQFKLFPNPNSGKFMVQMKGNPSSEIDFVLFNAIGQFIGQKSVEFSSGSAQTMLDFGNLPTGLYTLRVYSEGQAYYVKVAVEQ